MGSSKLPGRTTSTAILGGVGGGNARERADVVRRPAPKDKPDLARLKDDAKFALVALEPKHPDRCLSDANWAGPLKNSDKRRIAVGLTRLDLGIMIQRHALNPVMRAR